MTIRSFSFAEVAAKLSPEHPVSTEFDENGSRLLLYAPHPDDRQTPHPLDEIYVVARGTALFDAAEGQRQVVAGDAMFVSNGEVHKFEAPSPDFAVWAFFYPS